MFYTTGDYSDTNTPSTWSSFKGVVRGLDYLHNDYTTKEYRSKNIHFEECGCLGLEDDEDVKEVEDGGETTKEDDVNPSFLDKSEAGITHSMTLLDVNDKAEAPFDEPKAPQHNEPVPNAPIDEPEAPPFDEPEHNTPSDEAKALDDASNDSDEANDEPRPNPQDGASKAEPRRSSREKQKMWWYRATEIHETALADAYLRLLKKQIENMLPLLLASGLAVVFGYDDRESLSEAVVAIEAN
ncbi:hypothetical protein Tco_1259501 [Tanacetum coccineum]